MAIGIPRSAQPVIAERYVVSRMGRLDGRNAQCLGDEISLKSCGCLLRCRL
jgi:hypothetical protein